MPLDDARAPVDDIVLLYAGSREWFRAALEAVLQPEGFGLRWARDETDVLELVAAELPDLIIIDEHVGELSAPDLCRSLRNGPLPEHIPIVLYSSDLSTEGRHAEALEAGAWDVIREPIRAESLVASLNRLLGIAGLLGQAQERRFTERHSGLLTVRGLIDMLPTLEAMARREDLPLSCTVVGPTERAAGRRLRRKRDYLARLCSTNVRRADLCGWVRDDDVAIVALDARPEEAKVMAHRLRDASGEMARENDDPGATVSAGIVQLYPSRSDRTADERPTAEVVKKDLVSGLTAAREALESARRHGGGVRVAGTD